MLSKRTYKYRLYPTKKQVSKMEQILDICRTLYNSALLDRINRYKNTGKGLTYNQQAIILVKDKDKFPVLSQVYSQVLQDILRRVDKSFKNFFRRVKEKNSKLGFPRFKSEGRLHSFTYPQNGFEIINSKLKLSKNNKLKLSKIGDIKLKLHRNIEGKIKTCIIIKEIDKWYICFTVEINKQIEKRVVSNAIGIDVGIKNFAVFSDGIVINNPKYLIKSEDRLIKAQKLLSRKKKGTKNRKKQRILVAKQHRKIKNQRLDFHHKESHNIVNNYDLIVVEDLNIKGMVRNHCLAKSISDAGWGQFIGFVKYKAEDAGSWTIPVNPSGTSIECSNCGNRVPKTLADREHSCPACKTVLDRDHNSVINIKNKGLNMVRNEPLWRGSVVILPYETRSSILSRVE